MVIRHDPPIHYSRAPIMPSSSNGSMSSMLHPPYPSNSHHSHRMHQHHYHHARYYGPHHPSHQHSSPRNQHSPSNQASPSHHAALALQSMQHYHSAYYDHHHHQRSSASSHGSGHYHHHALHRTGSNVSAKGGKSNAPPVTAAPPSANTAESNGDSGFNMLIAAATSESMNSIDEAETITAAAADTQHEKASLGIATINKGILKKQRGKQFVSPLETNSEDENEKEKVGHCQEKADEKGEKEVEADINKEEALSAGPLKKRRKVDEQVPTATAADADEKQGGFLEILHQKLNNSESAMEWMPHGKSFRILRWDVLVEKVLPEIFTGENSNETDVDGWILLFKKKLREWGFVEVKRGRDYGTYFHELFVKNDPQLIHKITPTTTNRTELSPTFDMTQSGSSDGGMEWGSTRRVAHSIFKLPRTDEHHQEGSGGSAPTAGGRPPHPSYLHMPVLTNTATGSFAENWEQQDKNSGISRTSSSDHYHSNRHQGRPTENMYFPRPYPPNNSPRHTELKQGEGQSGAGRSPKIIRFREDEEARSHSRTVHGRHKAPPAVEISPNESKNTVETKETQDNTRNKPLQYDMVQITPNPEYNKHTAAPGYKHIHFPVSRRGGRGGMMMRPVSRHVGHSSSLG